MTVQELIDELLDVKDKARVVIVQKDREGNDYSPLDCIDVGGYQAVSRWSGEAWPDGHPLGKPALFLEPVN